MGGRPSTEPAVAGTGPTPRLLRLTGTLTVGDGRGPKSNWSCRTSRTVRGGGPGIGGWAKRDELILLRSPDLLGGSAVCCGYSWFCCCCRCWDCLQKGNMEERLRNDRTKDCLLNDIPDCGRSDCRRDAR